MSAFDSSRDNKHEMKLLLRRAINLRETVAGIYQKQRMLQLKKLRARSRERGDPVEHHPFARFFSSGFRKQWAYTPNCGSPGGFKLPIRPEGLKIGPLSKDWFDVPSDIDTQLDTQKAKIR